ncbi:MAG TPA: LacI family DNA-binding transcriptional regulator [Ktedonosporobacter sp.]|nr:LacI family DNA-binding transcriptional regulator [Ktedonosporobacter sp.]
MVTSDQVAQLAGVSRATVSRVLNGAPNVSEETKKRIYAAIATLGYEANIFARASQNRSQTIALALFGSRDGLNLSRLTDTQCYFYLELLRVIERELEQENYDLLLPARPYTKFGPIDDPETNYILNLQAKGVAGVITLALSSNDPRIQGLCRSSMPAVFIDSIFQGKYATYVKSDYRDAAREATDYLLALGHKRIASFPGDPMAVTGTERLMGYQQAMASAGLIMDPHLVRQSGWESKDAYQAALALLSERQDFTAIVAGSDMMAFGILRALRQYGLRVPEDVSVIGFDGIDPSEDADPPLTTIQQNKQALGQGAVARLLHMIKGAEAPAPLIVPAQLIVRASTGPVPHRSI